MNKNITTLSEELKKVGGKEYFIYWAAKEYRVQVSTVRTNYITRGEVAEKRGFLDRFIKDMQNCVILVKEKWAYFLLLNSLTQKEFDDKPEKESKKIFREFKSSLMKEFE